MNRIHARQRRAILAGAASLLLTLAALIAPAAIAAEADAAGGGFFLVASPAMQDPNFRHSVVLVAHTPDGGSIGFIVNRPGKRSLAEILPHNEVMKRFTEPLFRGGPVEAAGLFAMVRAKKKLPGTLRVLEDVSFALEPAAVERILHDPPGRVRFFNGYAGWGPGQLAYELAGGGWYVLSADADSVFRENTDTLWQDLLLRASAIVARAR